MRRAALPLVFALLASPATALELRYTGSYSLNRPASLDYDPTFCGLWIANEGPEAVLVTLEGEELRRIRSDLSRIKAIALEGDDLIVSDGMGRFQRLDKNGTTLADPFRIETGWADTEGIALTPYGTLITVGDDPEWLSWLSPDGEILKRLDTMELDPPMSEPQGIARDPRTGHLLIVDDWEGSNSLFELDETGAYLGSVPLIRYGMDPEGIALRPGSGQLFIAFDSGATIASFDYTPTLPPDAEPLPPGADCMMF